MINIPANATTAQIKSLIIKGGEFKFASNVKYKLTDTIKIPSNTKINLNGSSLRRYHSGPLLRLVDSKNISGYGGTHDVTITNGTLEGMNGSAYPYSPNSLLTMFHAKNITLTNVKFLDIPGCHAIDCCACKNVTIKNCKFEGYYSVGNDFREAIQVDYGYYGGLPTYAKGSPCYDMTRCDTITIDGCSFGKSKTFPAQYIAIGGHTIGCDNKYHTNIVIKNCTAEGNGGKNGTDTGFISIANFKNITITNNKIKNYNRFILVRRVDKTYDKDSNIKDKSLQKNVVNLTVKDNTIESHKGVAARWGIYCDVTLADGITVANNKGMTEESCYIKGKNLNIKYVK